MRWGPLKIAVIYVIAGVLWIALSDKLLLALQGSIDLDVVLFISSVKGIAYVLITGLLLYYLIRLYTNQVAESEKRYRTYFDDNPNPMWITDVRTTAFKDVNEAAIIFYGYSRERFMHMNLLDICPPEYKTATHTTLRNLKAGINKKVPFKHIKMDGSVVSVNIACHLINHHKGGNLMCMIENC